MSTVTITLIRHGRVDETLPNLRERRLSLEGIKQAEARRVALGHPHFDLICHSVLPRTKETALFVSGYPNTTSMVEIPGLFWDEGDLRGKAIEQTYAKLGHASLRSYLEERRNEIESLATEARSLIEGRLWVDNSQNILVVGHDIMIPALARELTWKADPFLDFVCEETEGFRLTFSTEGTSSIEIIRN